MRRFVLISLFAAMTLCAQTKLTPPQLAGEASTAGKIFAVLPSGTVVVADVGPGIVLDTSGPTPVLRATGGAVDACQWWKLATAQSVFNLDYLPIAQSLMVYRNGQLMAEGEDYTVAGKQINFLVVQLPAAGDIIQFRYRR